MGSMHIDPVATAQYHSLASQEILFAEKAVSNPSQPHTNIIVPFAPPLLLAHLPNKGAPLFSL